MKLKPGVKLNGVRPELLIGIMIVNQVFEDHGCEFTITEICATGGHSYSSLHYSGNACDIRSRDLSAPEQQTMAALARTALGNEFDLVTTEATHWHLEFQPKKD